MRLVLAALSRPITIVVALVAIALGAFLALQRMAVDIFPEGRRSGDLRRAALRRDGSRADGRIPDVLLRVSLSLHHGNRSRREQEHSGRGPDEADVLRRHRHEPGDGGDHRLCESRPRVHASWNRAAVCHAIRRGKRGRRANWCSAATTHTQGELQDYALNRVRPLFATLPGVSAPPPFGGNQRTIVIMLDPDKLHQYQISPDEAIAAVSKGSLVMPSGNMWTGTLNRIARTNAALGGNLAELLSTPIRPRAGRDGLSARYRNHREQHGSGHRVCARQWKADRVHSGDQALRCVDIGGDQRGEGRDSRSSGTPCRRMWM